MVGWLVSFFTSSACSDSFARPKLIRFSIYREILCKIEVEHDFSGGLSKRVTLVGWLVGWLGLIYRGLVALVGIFYLLALLVGLLALLGLLNVLGMLDLLGLLVVLQFYLTCLIC